MLKAKTAEKPAATKPVFVLVNQDAVTLKGNIIKKGESIDVDTWKNLCPRVQEYFRKNN